AMAKQFLPGDWRSGYYRDQTFMMAIGQLTVQQYFAALYAHTDIAHEPSSGGRQMGGHFATRFINADGSWKNQTEEKNSSADISPTAGQMPRLLGLAQASKIYRQNSALHNHAQFSKKGNEVAFGTIGDASTSEGLFWETMNAAAVLGVPLCMSVWDDGWGISVPKKFQTVKESISEALSGFEKSTTTNGIKIFKAKGWNFPELLATYERAVAYCRENHIPVLVHVEEITQPQGHSTSGSHERYKSKELLSWYERYDCIEQLHQFIVRDGAASAKELNDIREEAKASVREQQKAAWAAYREDIDVDVKTAAQKMTQASREQSNASAVEDLANQLSKVSNPIRKDIFQTFSKARRMLSDTPQVLDLDVWMAALRSKCETMYSEGLYSAASDSVFEVSPVSIEYDANPEMVDGRIILRENWDYQLSRRPELMIFGEDVGKIGGVNQTYEGLQEKHGELRIADTGIREATIVGQG
ncbi:MAG: thiamine pyrophosphate-dependent enzyme, partial [Flavobacteriales bacterium]